MTSSITNSILEKKTSLSLGFLICKLGVVSVIVKLRKIIHAKYSIE